MKTLSKCLVYLTMIIASVSPLSARAYSGGPLDGYVLEERTNKPIPGAIVVVRWQGTAFSFVDTHTVCMHVESATTDDQGRYHIASWRKSAEPVGVRNLEPIVTAHKAGYERSGVLAKKQDFEFLKRITGGESERLSYLERIEYATRCPNAEESEKNLLPFYRELHKEALSHVVTKDDQKVADGFLSNIEMIELGYDTAMRRAIERAEKRMRQ